MNSEGHLQRSGQELPGDAETRKRGKWITPGTCRDKPNLWFKISFSGRGQFLLTFRSIHLMKIVPYKIFARSFN